MTFVILQKVLGYSGNSVWKAGSLCSCCCCLVTKSCPTLLQPLGLQPATLLCPWDFPGKNAGLGCHFLLQGIFLTQGWNPHLLLGRWILYHGATWADVTAETRRHAARGADGDIWLVSRLNSGPRTGLKPLWILRESGYPYACFLFLSLLLSLSLLSSS